MQRRTRSLRDIHESNPRPLEDASATGDADRIPIGSVRPVPSATSHGAILGDGWASEVERVGGRRRLRGEVVMLAAGLVFLAAAMLKPWAGPAPALTASPTAASSPPPEIAAVPSPAITAAPTRIAYPAIPPYDYRGPYPFRPTASPATPALPALADLPSSWSAVDWSALSTSDSHADWGFATAEMAGRANGLTGPEASSPTTSWVALSSPPIYSAVPLVEGRYVYAIAVTWPSDLVVSRVAIVYLGGPEHPVYLPPPAFLPDSQVTPLPAVSVASASAAPAIDSDAIRSGEFLIPPTDASSTTVPRSIAAAWRSNPWPWPYGAYQVSVTSTHGTRRVVLDLLLTD
jgi:hypothetical protein